MKQDGYLDAMGITHVSSVAALTADEVYGRGGLCARIIDKPADDCVARGIDIDGDDGSVIEDELKRLNVLGALADAVRWSRLYGGACIVPVMQDAGSLSEPMNADTVGKLIELRVFAINEVKVARAYSNILEMNYNQAEIYNIRNIPVHESRLIAVSGGRLPASMKQGIHWRGRSDVSCFDKVHRYEKSLDWAERILKRKQQAVHTMDGLAEILENGAESLVRKRIDMIDQVRGVMNTVVIDGDDKYTVQDLGVSGIDSLVEQFQTGISADCGIPVSILFGVSAAGMNATGAGDFEGYYDMVESLQSVRMMPALERIVQLICAQTAVKTNYADLRLKFRSPYTPTEKEVSEVAKIRAETHKIYADLGVLNVDEIHAEITE